MKKMGKLSKETILPLIILFILFLPYASAGGTYIIIRANVNPMYIAGEPVQIQTFILMFRNGKPTDESATLVINVKGINVNYSYNQEITITGGKIHTYNLPPLDEGHYKISIFARKGGVNSQNIAFEFGVTKAPVPYDAHFSSDGSKFYFKSLRTNETGEIDQKYPFTLKLYGYTHGGGEAIIKTITNVTEITIRIPSSIKKAGGIAIVDVIDCYGWKNSATMDLSSFYFTGIPEMYDYGWKYREPFWSRRLPYIVGGVIALIISIVVIFYLTRWYRG